MPTVDVLIVGQGIAGTTLAWQLLSEGATIAVVDRGDRVTSSRIAAGLMTPITGKRLARSWRYREFYANAEPFYRRIESQTGVQFFHPRWMLKILGDDTEEKISRNKWTGEFAGLVHEPNPSINEHQLRVSHGLIEMSNAAQLDVPAYLDTSRKSLATSGAMLEVELNLSNDFRLNDRSVSCLPIGIEARFVVFCQGFQNTPNPWFAKVPFRPAKGEILTVRIPGFSEQRVIHHLGLWLAPTQDVDVWKVGSTYSWDELNNIPSLEGRTELVERLQDLLLIPFEVIDHHAAVRPIIFESKPRVGFHPEHPQLAYFNGLGSKGSLLAPTFARMLARAIVHKEPIDPDVDVQHFFEHKSQLPADAPNIRFTERVHRIIAPVLHPGDVVIDATAGNGHDTIFLARMVGPTGIAYAFDIQEMAIEKTRSCVNESQLSNVKLILADHATMSDWIAPEHRGKISAITFNLGYLPGGDKSIVTRPDSTLAAIRDAIDLLKPCGILTIIAYPGHPGGSGEANAVLELLANHRFVDLEVIGRDAPESHRPWLMIARRK